MFCVVHWAFIGQRPEMPLISCPDCDHSISDQAPACPNCGRPTGNIKSSAKSGAWQAVVKSRTPINVFALAMMACASVFGFSATNMEEDALKAFTYSLHVFLALSGMFFVCLLFCRSAIYHPEDLAKAKQQGVTFGKDRPVLAAVLIGGLILIYGAYQAGLFEWLE